MLLLIFWKEICSLSKLIRIVRKKALLSQEDLAKALDVSVGTINRWGNNISFDKNEATWIARKEYITFAP